MTDIIIILILLAIVVGAGGYIYRARKSGQKCIGCPHARECGNASCSGQCGNAD